MSTRAFIPAAFALLFSLFLIPDLRAQSAAPAEKARIEGLITHVEGLNGARFIRNGAEYDPKTAAKFLRRKWQSHEAQIKTAPDFIAIAATRSSTSGKPYLIRLEGSEELSCANYLTARLKKQQAAKDQ